MTTIEEYSYADNIDYRTATDEERLQSSFVGDPIADYHGRPDIQQQILAAERSKESDTEDIPGAIGTLLTAEAFPEEHKGYHYRLRTVVAK